MRVLHLYSGNLFGGIETLLVTLARHREVCPDMQIEIGLCFEGRLSAALADEGVALHHLGPVRIRHPWTVWQARRRLQQLLETRGFDAVICHSCWPHVLFSPVVRNQGLPLIFWAHDAHHGGSPLERWSRCTLPDLVIANSRFTAGLVGKLFGAVPCEVVLSPAAGPPEYVRAEVRTRVRGGLGTNVDKVVIVQHSRLERWKGHLLLLEALGHMRDVPGWECWMTGRAQRAHEEDYLKEIQAMIVERQLAGHVRLLGQVPDIPQLLTAADIHCQANVGPEPLGLAFVEALYAGLPVVTTEMGGALEIVNANCGRLVPPDNPRQLATALEQLVHDRDLRITLGSAGPARAAELCGPEIQITRLGRIVQRLAIHHQRAPEPAIAS